jgi:hypothetical protein
MRGCFLRLVLMILDRVTAEDGRRSKIIDGVS